MRAEAMGDVIQTAPKAPTGASWSDEAAAAGWLDRGTSIVLVRWILGVQCLVSGLNWWFKILPFPNMFDPVGLPMKHAIVAIMIDTGWMFTAAKLVEILVGLALLTNRFAVLMLVVAFPVLMMTFALDAVSFGHAVAGAFAGEVTGRNLWAAFLDMIFFGGAVFLMQGHLMLEWFANYRHLLVATPDGVAPAGWSCPRLMAALRWASILIGGASTIWILGMIPFRASGAHGP
ncbi:MAG: hypothetical protein B7Z20_05070 [Sphingobium sp. 32-64-5]|nr:MAG: hypothetical protein B7Z20_05070 [Sphingobium sp. 32-64-5]